MWRDLHVLQDAGFPIFDDRVRPKLVDLLQEFENTAVRQRLAGESADDFGWMWAELGLDRPG